MSEAGPGLTRPPAYGDLARRVFCDTSRSSSLRRRSTVSASVVRHGDVMEGGMSESKKGSRSKSGDRIYRHGQAADWQPPGGQQCVEQISNHIEVHLGKAEAVFYEFISDTVYLNIHRVGPTAELPFFTLITPGMSDLPMSVPAEIDAPKHLELLITLPGNWKFDEESLKDEAWYWPIRLLKILARFPHKHNTWLGWGHTVPNGDPPRPYAQNTKLSGAIILTPIFVPDGFDSLPIDERKVIHFFSFVILYKKEMDLKLRSGTKTLLEKLVRANISGSVDINRPNVARKRFGLF